MPHTLSPAMAGPAALVIFALTLAFMLWRPRGLHEAWPASLGALAMLALGQVSLHQGFQVVAQSGDVLLFLLALMLLSALLDRSGFFEWAALHCARLAKGSTKTLYRNVFVLGALTTMVLSLDTTAIVLTPIVLAFVRRLKLPALPFVLACVFVANTASLLLPVSNLTNLLFQSHFHMGFARFTATMLLPQIVVIVLNYGLFYLAFRKTLPRHFDHETLPHPRTVVADQAYFATALWVFAAVTVGYFIGGLWGIKPYMVALAGCLVLLGAGLARGRVDKRLWRDISLPLFPFVIGLFIVMRGVENLGAMAWAQGAFAAMAHWPVFAQTLGVAFATGLGANIINNIPMALAALKALPHEAQLLQYGALLGCNLGPNLTVTGSLATMLVLTGARQKGVNLGAAHVLRLGVWVMPLLLAFGCAGLYAGWLILH